MIDSKLAVRDWKKVQIPDHREETRGNGSSGDCCEDRDFEQCLDVVLRLPGHFRNVLHLQELLNGHSLLARPHSAGDEHQRGVFQSRLAVPETETG